MSKIVAVRLVLFVIIAPLVFAGSVYADDSNETDSIHLVPRDEEGGSQIEGLPGNPANCTVEGLYPSKGGGVNGWMRAEGEVECDYWVDTIILEVCLQKESLWIWFNQGCKTETLFADDFLGVGKDVDCMSTLGYHDYRTKAHAEALINGVWYYGTSYSNEHMNQNCKT